MLMVISMVIITIVHKIFLELHSKSPLQHFPKQLKWLGTYLKCMTQQQQQKTENISIQFVWCNQVSLRSKIDFKRPEKHFLTTYVYQHSQV